jgi:uncharacterized Zn-binding protein involved in type VI secretion
LINFFILENTEAMKNNNNKFIFTAVLLLCAVIFCNAQSTTNVKPAATKSNQIAIKGDQNAPKGNPAARVGDMHVCPMSEPGTPPVPHVGGPILPPGCPTVLIGGIPAARMGDMCTCVGPSDKIVTGSATVLICGKPAARMGDATAHGGTISVGCSTVLIGN